MIKFIKSEILKNVDRESLREVYPLIGVVYTLFLLGVYELVNIVSPIASLVVVLGTFIPYVIGFYKLEIKRGCGKGGK